MNSVNAAAPSRPLQPILTITTLKNWVLPPRPKNARKSKVVDKKKKPPTAIAASTTTPKTADASLGLSSSMQSSGSLAVPRLESVDELHSNIRVIDRENYHLKTRLLSLIHDYKSLRALVLRTNVDDSPALYDTATTARKRLYTEMGDPMSELIVNMNELSHTSPTGEFTWDLEPLTTPMEASVEPMEPELFDFVNLDSDFEDLDDHAPELAEIDDDLDSRSLSRSISPSASEIDENLLMATLTRSTTVSTNNSSVDRKPTLFKFYDLPAYSEDSFHFSFDKVDPHDKMMSVIEEDHYNQVADFLEEKLMSNDVKYYVEKSSS